MLELTNAAAVLEGLIPYGRDNAISRAALATALGLTDRGARQLVSKARRDGMVIINAQDGKGYYRTRDANALRRQLAQTHHRALSLLAQEKHIKAAIRAAEEED